MVWSIGRKVSRRYDAKKRSAIVSASPSVARRSLNGIAMEFIVALFAPQQ
jgi:hypothetical protein